MRTKLKAAQMVTRFGGRVLIANGKIPYVIKKSLLAKKLEQCFFRKQKNCLIKSDGLVTQQILSDKS